MMAAGVTMDSMKSAAGQASAHPGDLALLRAAGALARAEIGSREIMDAAGVLHEALMDADWAAHGTAGLVPLLGCCAGGWEDESASGPRHVQVRAIGAEARRFCKARGLTGSGLHKALSEGLAVAVAAEREAGRGGTGWDAGETLARTALASLPAAAMRECFGQVMARARADCDRLVLAGAGLACMRRLLAERRGAAWRPKPACVAWLLAGLACPRAGSNADGIHDESCQTPAARYRPDGGAPGGSALEWLLTRLAQTAIAWDDAEADAFRQADKAAWRSVGTLDRRERKQRQETGAVRYAWAALDDEDIAHVRAGMRDALAMRDAAMAFARMEGGGTGRRRRWA